MDDDVLATVVECEKRLLVPACRADEDCLRELLHPDFMEFGVSGAVWTFDRVVRDLPSAPPLEGAAGDFSPSRLADDVVLLTFRLTSGRRTSLRSSVWVRGEDGRWRLRFHQGTRTEI